MDAARIDYVFRYHSPTPADLTKYERLRTTARLFGEIIAEVVPDCVERDTAIERLREAVMWANAGLACFQEGRRP